VKGAKSKYVNKHNIPIAKELFPGMSLETLDAGHWGTCRPSYFLRKYALNLLDM